MIVATIGQKTENGIESIDIVSSKECEVIITKTAIQGEEK